MGHARGAIGNGGERLGSGGAAKAIGSAPIRGPSTEPRTQPSPVSRVLPTSPWMLPTLLPTSA